MKKKYDWDRPILPIHPEFKGGMTIRQCYDVAMRTGVSADIVAGFVMGKVLPPPEILERFKVSFDKDVIEKMAKDYQPLRFYKFYEDDHPSKSFEIDTWLPATLLEEGDMIRCKLGDESYRWIIVSDTISTKEKIKIFSNGYLCAVVSARAHLIVARSTSKTTINKLKHLKRENPERIIDAISKIDLSTRKYMVEEFVQQIEQEQQD